MSDHSNRPVREASTDNAATRAVEQPADVKTKGISLKRLTSLTAVVTVVVSLLLLFFTYLNFKAYYGLKQVSEDYIIWQNAAEDMQRASDYLTEEARSFTETGEREYLDNYFTEANETRRRNNALNVMHEMFPDSPISETLALALQKSTELMDREYYAMRLKLESMGEDLSDYPDELRSVVLSPEDSALSADEKNVRSHEILFDHTYNDAKLEISRNTSACLSILSDELINSRDSYTNKLNSAMIASLVLILLYIFIFVGMVILSSSQVFNPLIKSISHIRHDDPLPIQGAYEFRELAKTYNDMRELNTSKKRTLTYKADHDPLTGVLNRRGFDKLRPALSSKTVAAIFVDVDNFKNINDTFGHLVGDRILKDISGILKKNFDEKLICRIGGDEFLIVMENVTKQDKQRIVHIFDDINEQLLRIHGDLPAVTLSAGVAFGNSLDDRILLDADDALYHTKQSGKCGVSFKE